MLDQKTLDELKSSLPHRHANLIITKYKELYNEDTSRWTINRFFNRKTYSEKLHNAILSVAKAQQLLTLQTKEVISK